MFSSSTKSTASTSSYLYKSCIAWMAVSALQSCPVQPCGASAASWTSFLATCISIFPAIWPNTSCTSIGGSPGFLFCGINRLDVSASKLPSKL